MDGWSLTVILKPAKIKFVNQIISGYSLRRGRILRLMHGPTLHKAKLDLAEGLIDKAQFIAVTR